MDQEKEKTIKEAFEKISALSNKIIEAKPEPSHINEAFIVMEYLNLLGEIYEAGKRRGYSEGINTKIAM